MVCPLCKKVIGQVRVVSECYQYGELKGNKVDDYGSVEEITETIDVICPECNRSIIDYVEQ
jgi:hypothetical protein